MDIKIGSLQYSIEEAFNIFAIECSDNDQDDQESKVFDKYGNYTFPTETSFSTPNCLLSVSKNNYQDLFNVLGNTDC